MVIMMLFSVRLVPFLGEWVVARIVSIPLFCIYFKNHVHVNSIHKSYFIDPLARWLQVTDNVVDILAIR